MNPERPCSPKVWEQTPAVVQDYIRALAARVAALEAAVQQLGAAVQRLTERVPQDARTSSRPPSSDRPQAIGKRARRTPSGRRPGGQPGHEGQTRALIPVKPGRCHRCQRPLQGENLQPQRHQVTEIPPMKPVVTEYQLHCLVCPACGEPTRAELPVGVPSGECGPRLQAIAALCTGAYHLSKRTPQRVMADLGGVSIRLGTRVHLEQATVQAVAEPVAAARAYVQEQPTAYLDETGWREGQARAWLGTAVTTWVTVFGVRLSRSAKVAQELWGARFWGYWVTERWSAYAWDPAWRRQLCGAHLMRDLEAMIERGGPSPAMGEALRVQARQMFPWWHRVCEGTLAHARFAS
jgi:transposase